MYALVHVVEAAVLACAWGGMVVSERMKLLLRIDQFGLTHTESEGLKVHFWGWSLRMWTNTGLSWQKRTRYM